MVHVAYYTDHLCPWSWVAEPELRRILVEFSEQVRITYVMAGMAEDIQAEEKLASTLDAVAETGVAADPRMWSECPPSSSYPACIAVKAAGLQDLDEPYLLRLREGAFLRRERIESTESFLRAGRDVHGLDLRRFEADLASGAAAALFEEDRRTALAACGDGRPSLPAFSVDGGAPIGIAELHEAIASTAG